jgi:hypothetical protein
MSDPIGLEAASRHAACDLVSGDTASEPVQGETRIGQANTCQPGGWGLDPVPFDGTYGARTFPLAAAPKDGSDSVCELEYSPLPPVCVADDEAAALDAAKARGEKLLCPPTENRPPCPGEWRDAVPAGWKKYQGIPSVFHCGFRGMVADCGPDGDHLQRECFYDDAGQLVSGEEDARAGDYVHIDYRCAGTANADDSTANPGRHIFTKGGIIRSGWTGFVGSIMYYDRLEHEAENETDPPDSQDGR